jgi:hypothetical protein
MSKQAALVCRCCEPTKRSGYKNKCKRKVPEDGCKCHSHRLKHQGFSGVAKNVAKKKPSLKAAINTLV